MIPQFNERYMKKRMHIAWRGPIIANAIVSAIRPTSVLDMGCATGDYAAAINDMGILVLGLDSSPDAGQCLHRDHYMEWDLMEPPPIGADLVILLEVLSVVEDPETILDNAAGAAIKYLLVNRHPWLPQNFVPDRLMTERLKHGLRPWANTQAIKALYNTGEVLKRIESEE